MRNLKGFTIIELTVVISVIAILAMTLTSDMARYYNESQDVSVRSDMHQLSTSSAVYSSDTNNPAPSSFCNSDMEQKIASAINKINSRYILTCTDPSGAVSTGGANGGNNGGSTTNDSGGTGSLGLQANCSAGQWYSFVQLSDGTYWCTDWQLNSKASQGNSSTCSC